MGFFKRIARKVKKAVNKVVDVAKNVVKKTAEGIKKVAEKAVDVVKQGVAFAKSAVKMAMTPMMMMGAIVTGKGVDAARDMWVNNMSEFGQEFNKLVDSAMQLGVAMLDATPAGQLLNKIPGYEMVKAIVVDMVASTFKSIGNVLTTAAAVVGAIGEESFKSVMSKVGDLALNVLDAASSFVPAGKVASVIAKAAMAVDAGMTVKTLANEDSREAAFDAVKGLKDNPAGVAMLAVGAAAGGVGGGRNKGGGSSNGGASTPGVPSATRSVGVDPAMPSKSGSSPAATPKAASDTAAKPASDNAPGKKNDADEDGGMSGDVADVATEVGMTVALTPAPAERKMQPVSSQFPQFADYGGLQSGDLASLLFLASVFGDDSSFVEMWTDDPSSQKPKTSRAEGQSNDIPLVAKEPVAAAAA